MKIHIYLRENGNGKEVKKVELELVNMRIKLPPQYLNLKRKMIFNPISECYIPLTDDNVVYHYK